MHPGELHKRSKGAEGRLLDALNAIGSEVGLDAISLPSHRDSDIRGMLALQAMADYAELISGATTQEAPAAQTESEDKPKRGRKAKASE